MHYKILMDLAQNIQVSTISSGNGSIQRTVTGTQFKNKSKSFEFDSSLGPH